MIDANSIENGPSGNICLPIVQSDSRCRALLLGRVTLPRACIYQSVLICPAFAMVNNFSAVLFCLSVKNCIR